MLSRRKTAAAVEHIAPATARRTLPRTLGAFTATAVLIGAIVGSGIFRVPSAVAATVGGPSGLMLVWVFGGLIALFGALSMAELAAMFPRTGGPYVYLLKAYGRPLAFLFGWMWLLTAPISWAALSLTFAQYLATLVPLTNAAQHWIAALAIVFFCALQYRSVHIGAFIQNLATTTKVLALLGLALVIFLLAPHLSPGGTTTATAQPMAWSGIGIALVAVLWAYDGWEDLTTLSGEIRNPGKNVPIALIVGTLIVVAVYLLVNAAYLRALPYDQLTASRAVASDAMVAAMGPVGAAATAVLIMVSVLGTLNGSVLTHPRVFFAMAEDNLFFASIGKVHPRFETPYVAIILTATLAVIYVLLRNFIQLAEAYVLGVWPFLALAVIGLFILRRKRPDIERPYKALGYPVVPALFILGTFFVIAYALWQQPVSTGVSIAITLVGIPLYIGWERLRRRRT
ncbi:MAG TPA: amino acid permease [Gammaproteobacteria bacterium]|nr:amino acid permease [Gammaproteobacteria bacterium]